MRSVLTLTALGLMLVGSTFACDDPDCPDNIKNPHHNMHMQANATPATKAYMAEMHKMHEAMEFTYTGDADVDFLKGMIVHHQGAVDMANTVLKYGKDEQVKALAQNIVKTQTAEIAEMKDWLTKLEAAQKVAGTAK